MGLLIHLGVRDSNYVVGAWIFVGFRVIHSLVHCSVNNIKLRFSAYCISTIALWWMWFEFGQSVLKN